MNDFNPVIEMRIGAHIVKARLTELCHNAGTRAASPYNSLTGRMTKTGDEAYRVAYYETLKKLMPGHPALISLSPAEGQPPLAAPCRAA